MKGIWGALISVLLAIILFASLMAQTAANERTFLQSKAAVEKALKQLPSSGRLPTLEGFVSPGNRSLERYQRGFYQCSVQLNSAANGTVVRVSAKITAWYSDPDVAKSGYQVLPSNGRLESDLLDQLGDGLAKETTPLTQNGRADAKLAPAFPARTKADAGPAISAPQPQDPEPIIATKKPEVPPASPFQLGSSSSEDVATQRAVADRRMEELKKEAKNLEEILHNQARPTNLVAVKKSGTPISVSPNVGAKVMFLASAEDEFEILDKNAGWVHVRISGLSRGWILRSNVEIPETSVVEPTADVPATTPPPAKGQVFQVENEQITTFPGNWVPLRGKTVEIVSVRKTNEQALDGGSQAKLDFAKSVFERKYSELSKTASNAAGVVVIFDSEDGGMMAATLPVLQNWKDGNLSDEALWRRCYFDPPELYNSTKGQ